MADQRTTPRQVVDDSFASGTARGGGGTAAGERHAVDAVVVAP